MGDSKTISRRSFIKEAGIGALSLAAGTAFAESALAQSSAAASSAASGSASAVASGSASASGSTTSGSATSASASTSAASASGSASASSAAIDPRYTADLTVLFADDDAFNTEAARIESEDFPKLQDLANNVKDAASLAAYFSSAETVLHSVEQCNLYAAMKFYTDSSDPVAAADNGTASKLGVETDMIQSVINEYLQSLDDQTWKEYLASDDLATWRRTLQTIYDTRDYVLTASEEKLLSGEHTAADNINATHLTLFASDAFLGTTTDPDGNEVTLDNSTFGTAQMTDDRDWRQRSYEIYYESLTKVEDIFAANLNAFVKLKEDLSVAHHYDSALDDKMINDELSVDIFDELIASTRKNLDAYAFGIELRAKTLGLDHVMPWDRSAAWAQAPDISFSYDDAQSIIIEALSQLGDDYVSTLKDIFDGRWIDVYPTPGKVSGAVTISGDDWHPYIIMNYADDFYSMDTLAHELGHLIHYLYSGEAQKTMFDRGIKSFVTEIASITNETLLMDYLIANAADDTQKLYYLSYEIRLIETTFFRQVMFAAFEQQIHQTAADGGTLTAADLDATFNKFFAEFCPGIETPDINGIGWSYVGHFYLNHYVQGYAFAIVGAFNVAAAIESGDKDALENYLDFLKSGNSVPADELYAKVGVDLTSDSYIDPLIEKYKTLLSEAEALL